MEIKAIVTTHEDDLSGERYKRGEGYEWKEFILTTNTLFPTNLPFPPISLVGLGLGAKEKSNYKPHASIDRIEFIEPSNINIELTNTINQKLKEITENWLTFIYLEFYNGKIYRNWTKGVVDSKVIVNEWNSNPELPDSVEEDLVNAIDEIKIKTSNWNSRTGYIFIVKKENEQYLIESKSASNFSTSKYRGSTEWWWLEDSELKNANKT